MLNKKYQKNLEKMYVMLELYKDILGHSDWGSDDRKMLNFTVLNILSDITKEYYPNQSITKVDYYLKKKHSDFIEFESKKRSKGEMDGR